MAQTNTSKKSAKRLLTFLWASLCHLFAPFSPTGGSQDEELAPKWSSGWLTESINWETSCLIRLKVLKNRLDGETRNKQSLGTTSWFSVGHSGVGGFPPISGDRDSLWACLVLVTSCPPGGQRGLQTVDHAAWSNESSGFLQWCRANVC